MAVKVRKRTVHSVSDDEGSFELTNEPSDTPTIVRVPGEGTVVGYLAHDSDCSSPLEDCDGMGEILDRRSRYGGEQNKDRVYELLGYNEYGEQVGKPDPLVVLLDVYSHGGDAWRVHNGGKFFPDERWDVSNGAGLWVPDGCCRENIEYMAVKALLPEGTTVNYESKYNPDGTAITRPPQPGEKPYFTDGTCIDERYHNVITYKLPDGRKKGGYKNFETAIRAAAKKLGIKIDKAAFAEARRAAAVKMAEGVVEEYNKWLSGDCHGVCIEVFDEEGEAINLWWDSCWGYIGREYVEQELKERVAYAVKSLTEKEPTDGVDLHDGHGGADEEAGHVDEPQGVHGPGDEPERLGDDDQGAGTHSQSSDRPDGEVQS